MFTFRLQAARSKVKALKMKYRAAFELLNQQKNLEVIILARGGGSLEDLQAFNTEIVARAIYASRIPVISAVGHETDYTIADFVADMRAPTPSAAAELVVPVKEDLKYTLSDLTRQLSGSINRFIDHKRIYLTYAAKKLKDPKKRIQDLRIHMDDLINRLTINMKRQLQIETGAHALAHPKTCHLQPWQPMQKT